jgi:hypothetical protein
MIGFKMKAHGTNGFKQKRSAWTEGSMMALKVLATIGSVIGKDKQGGGQRGALSSIEANFKRIADQMFASMCAQGLDFTLFVTGDINFKFFFDSSKRANQIQSELYNLFKSQVEEIGDQVMIYFCRIVNDFVARNLSRASLFSAPR